MRSTPKLEMEMIRYEKIHHIRVFMNSILFRNMHEHSAFEIDLILDGNGRIRRADDEFTVSAGAVLLFNPYEPHEITAEPAKPLQILSVQISDHFCQDYYPSIANIEFGACKVDGLLSRTGLRKVRREMFSVAYSFFREQPTFQLDCVGGATRLLAALQQGVPHVILGNAAYSASKNKTARIRRLVGYIDQHFEEKIMLSTLAEMEGISVTHLSHFFKDSLHMSFQEYLNNRRLEKALALMQDPNLSLLQICMECGFSDGRYLNRMFAKEFGCTAVEYRQRLAASGERLSRSEPSSYSEFLYGRTDSLSLLKSSEFSVEYDDTVDEYS